MPASGRKSATDDEFWHTNLCSAMPRNGDRSVTAGDDAAHQRR